mmetsp:Transcript_51757/g.85735  ORF Transcript_51757/g.85735 Transcript_51757/m.85735 type:complete len:350 (-) Transcript_51757:30-1079(-)
MSHSFTFICVSLISSLTTTSSSAQQSVINCTEQCIIQCNEAESCQNTVVNANDVATLSINCTYDNACDDITIWALNAGSVTFNAFGYAARYINIYANYSQSVSVQCKGIYSCYYLNVYADHVEALASLYAVEDGFSFSVFSAKFANAVSVRCAAASRDTRTCSATWFMPDYGENVVINCDGYGCTQFGELFVDTSVESMSVAINSCGICEEANTRSSGACIDNNAWIVYCDIDTDYGSYFRFYGTNDICVNYGGRTCGCDTLIENVRFTDDEDLSECELVNGEKRALQRSIYIIIGCVAGVCCVCICIFFCAKAYCMNRTQSYESPTSQGQPVQMQMQQMHQQQMVAPM